MPSSPVRWQRPRPPRVLQGLLQLEPPLLVLPVLLVLLVLPVLPAQRVLLLLVLLVLPVLVVLLMRLSLPVLPVLLVLQVLQGGVFKIHVFKNLQDPWELLKGKS